MALGLHILKDPGDLAFAINHKRGAGNAHYFLAVHVFFFDHPEGICHLLFLVGQQGIRQLVLLFEFKLGAGGIGRDAQHHQAGLLQFFVGVAEPARFQRSPGSVSLRIEE